MADKNYNPNARYDNGPNAAGSGRLSNQATLNSATPTTGLQTDSTVKAANLRTGFNAAGMVRSNTGPNVAGAPRSVNGV